VNVASAFTAAVLQVVFAILTVVQWLVIIAAVISWVSPDPRNPIVQFLYRATNPMLRPFRKILPPGRTGGIDFSPLLLLLLILFLKVFLSRLFLVPATF
jgi:YggT family protein